VKEKESYLEEPTPLSLSMNLPLGNLGEGGVKGFSMFVDF